MGRWKIWLMAIAVAALSFWIAGSSEAFKNCIHQRKNDKAYSALHQSPSVISRTIVRWFSLDVACAGEFAEKDDGAITALSTVLLTIITGGLVWVGFVQLVTTRAQLRAYVHITFDRNDVYDLRIGAKPACNVQIENSGQTPAFEASIAAGLEVLDYPEPRTFKESKTHADEAKVAVHPNQKVAITVWRVEELTAPEFEAVVSRGDKRLYLFGVINYRDTFGTPRKTTFRWMTRDPKREVPGVKVGAMSMIPCRYGNEAT